MNERIINRPHSCNNQNVEKDSYRKIHFSVTEVINTTSPSTGCFTEAIDGRIRSIKNRQPYTLKK